jgi:hypothetical protein
MENEKKIYLGLAQKIFLVIVIISVTFNIKPAFCISSGTSAYGSGSCGGEEPEWNPILGNGLIGIRNASCDWDLYVDFHGHFSGSADAAVYGSDTSWVGIMSHYAEGLSVEPMSHSRAQVSGGTVDMFCTTKGSGAWGMVEVYHRLKERTNNPLPPDTPNLIEILNNVHVNVAYSLSAQVDGIGSAGASFEIRPYGISRAIDSGQLNGIISFTAAAGTYFYIRADSSISVSAGLADCTDNTHSSGQAVADPFAHIDPSWEYAGHFVVEQQSELNPGEWVEVTRKWKNFCEADINSVPDGDVDGKDFSNFIVEFGTTECNGECQSDFDEDGDVDENDLLIFIADFGKVNCSDF